jgi:hypothetical protein
VRGFRDCHDHGQIPISLSELGPDDPVKWGLGRSIYFPKPLAEFQEFQMSQAVADEAKLASSRSGLDGEWGLALTDRATNAIIDLLI